LRISDLQSGKVMQTSWSRSETSSEKAVSLTPAPRLTGKEWSPYGKLVRGKSTNGGMPRYWLENQSGLVMLHLAADDDATLREYVGRSISVFGPMTNGNTVRVTHIAVP
jgi:hypothetical protein